MLTQLIIDDLNKYGREVPKELYKIAVHALKTLDTKARLVFDNYDERWYMVW